MPREVKPKEYGVTRKIKFEIVVSGAPEPFDSFWRLIGSNGREFARSDLMAKKNAKKSVLKIVEAIRYGKYSIFENVKN